MSIEAFERVNAAPSTDRVDSDAAPPEPGVALYDLKPNQCLYAVAEPTSRFHLFCAATTQLGKAFCPVHQALCYPDDRGSQCAAGAAGAAPNEKRADHQGGARMTSQRAPEAQAEIKQMRPTAWLA
jgi:hypothetical protein